MLEGGMLDSLLARCTFPPSGTAVVCGLSGGADSAALVALAVEAGCIVTAVHVDHGLRVDSAHDAHVARQIAERFDVAFRVVEVALDDGPNLEARARAARRHALGPNAMTGHTADDQAETFLLALLRGSGATGLGAIEPGPRHPILALRRSETVELCHQVGLDVADDPTNADPRFRRNRIRHELLPLLDDIAERDMAVLLNRTASHLRDDDQLLEDLASPIDPTHVDQLLAAPGPLATRAIRRWLERDGYPPDAAGVARVIAVAAGEAPACELAGGLRIECQGRRLVLFPPRPSTR
jgi:tRNA(Ile)-lysidine synthase